jgi:hypothetical protein
VVIMMMIMMIKLFLFHTLCKICCNIEERVGTDYRLRVTC